MADGSPEAGTQAEPRTLCSAAVGVTGVEVVVMHLHHQSISSHHVDEPLVGVGVDVQPDQTLSVKTVMVTGTMRMTAGIDQAVPVKVAEGVADPVNR